MIHMGIILDGDGAWPDLGEKTVHKTTVDSVTALAAGMVSGNTSVAVRVNLPDGSVVIAETSLRLFLGAAAAFRARYGDQ